MDVSDNGAAAPSAPLLEAILGSLGCSVLLVDEAGRLCFATESVGEALGYSREELLRLHLADIEPAFSTLGWEGLWAAVSCHLPVREGRTFLGRRGRPVHLEVEHRRFAYAGRSYLLMVADGVARNDQSEQQASERARLQQAMQAQAREFRTLVENLQGTLVRWDRESRVVYINRAMELLLGAAPGEKVGSRLLDETGAPWLTLLQQKFTQVLEGGEPAEADLEVPGDSGLHVEHVRLVPKRGAEGEIKGVLMLGQDVTARFLSEAELRNSIDHYRDIFLHSPDGLYLLEVTEEGRFRNLDINPALARSVGVDASQLIGRFIEETVPEETARAVNAKYRRCVEAGERIEEEIELAMPVGRMWYHSTLMPVRNAAGRVHRIVGISRNVTEQKRMELALRESEQRYRDIFDNTLESVFLLEVTEQRRFRTLEINTAFEHATGVTRAEAVGRLVEEILPGPMAAVVNGKYTRALESGGVHDEEIELDLPVGRRIFHSTLIPVRDASGGVYRITGITRDITEKKRMEAALARREREFHSLAENLPDNVIRYDCAGRVVYMNPMLGRTLGVDPVEALGKRLPELLGSFPWTQRFADIIAHGTPTSAPEAIKITLSNPDGEERVHLVRLVTERDETGAITGTLGIGRDITEMERAAALLHERAETFRALVENSPDAIIRYDGEGRRSYVNPAVERLFSRPNTDLLGREAGDSSPLSEPTDYSTWVRAAFERGEELQGETRYVSPAGETRWAHMRLVPEFGPDGQVVSVLAVGRDITGLKETGRRLEESQAELRQLAARQETVREEERKRLARELHDELGQLLMGLRLEITVAEHQLGDPLLRERLGRMMRLLDKTSRVLRELITSLRPVALDMGLLPALEWLARDFSERTGLRCELRVGEEELELSEDRSVAIFRILQESLTNVARHARANRVTISLAWQGSDYRLEVRDDGCGFDPSQLRKGSFGLMGVRERALALGGTARVTSAPGAGTSVEVLVPVQLNDNTRDNHDPSAACG